MGRSADVRRPVLLLAFVAPLLLGACESSQTTSARLEKLGAKAAVTKSVTAGVANPDVRVVSTQLIRGTDTTAAVVELESTGRRDQVGVPIQIDVRDAKGTSTYKNDLDGLQPSLQQLAYLPAGKRAFWINDQVLQATPAKRLTVKVGKPRAAAPTEPAPRITLEDEALETDESGTFIKGVVRNRSKIPQLALPIYGVVRKGGRIVAAGRALVERVDPDPTPKPVVFRILLAGANPRGGEIEAVPVPTTFTPEGAKTP